jgi:hypothetical protein
MAKRVSLFSKEAVESLRKEKFSGEILIRWKKGVINDFDLNREFDFNLKELEIEA